MSTERQPPLGMSGEHWRLVSDLLDRFVPDRAVSAFGSRVRGTSRQASDLDLLIHGETPLHTDTSDGLLEALREAPLPFKVDVLDEAATSMEFLKLIEGDLLRVKGPSVS